MVLLLSCEECGVNYFSAASGMECPDCGAELEPAGRQQIEEAVSAVDQLLAAEDPKTQTGDVEKLKAAVATLDEVTKVLADLLMDKAMDAMLRRKGLIQG